MAARSQESHGLCITSNGMRTLAFCKCHISDLPPVTSRNAGGSQEIGPTTISTYPFSLAATLHKNAWQRAEPTAHSHVGGEAGLEGGREAGARVIAIGSAI